MFIGKKSDEKDSPAYIPTLFSFVSSPKKRAAKQSIGRYHSAKRCAVTKQRNIRVQSNNEEHAEAEVPTRIEVQAGMTQQVIKQLELDN